MGSDVPPPYPFPYPDLQGAILSVEPRRSWRLAEQRRQQDHQEARHVFWVDEEGQEEPREQPQEPSRPPLPTVSPTRPSLVGLSVIPVGSALGPNYGRTGARTSRGISERGSKQG